MKFKTVVVTLLALSSAACMSLPAPGMMAPATNAAAGQAQEVYTGVVLNARPVLIRAPEGMRYTLAGTSLGALGGAALGSYMGSRIGKGRGKTTATVAGAILGGAVGSAIQAESGAQPAQELVVKLDNGQLRSITQPLDQGPALQAGQRVYVIGGGWGAGWRVVPGGVAR